MIRKYKFTGETMEFDGHTLHRIRALLDMDIIGYGVRAGDLGGWIETENNLSHEGTSWVANEAKVFNSAHVFGNAYVCDYAQICGCSLVYHNARVCGNSFVTGHALIYDEALLCGDAVVCGTANVFGITTISTGVICRTEQILTIGPMNVRDDFDDNISIYTSYDDGVIYVSSCGFDGTLEEFTHDVDIRYGNTECGARYKMAIQFASNVFEKLTI